MCHIEATLMAQGVTAFLALTTPSPQENKQWLAESLSVRRMGLDPECPSAQFVTPSVHFSSSPLPHHMMLSQQDKLLFIWSLTSLATRNLFVPPINPNTLSKTCS